MEFTIGFHPRRFDLMASGGVELMQPADVVVVNMGGDCRSRFVAQVRDFDAQRRKSRACAHYQIAIAASDMPDIANESRCGSHNHLTPSDIARRSNHRSASLRFAIENRPSVPRNPGTTLMAFAIEMIGKHHKSPKKVALALSVCPRVTKNMFAYRLAAHEFGFGPKLLC
jgi:hypothetical protein